MKRIINGITLIVSLFLAVALLVTLKYNIQKNVLIIEASSLMATITINICFNFYFIYQVNKIEVAKAELIKIANAKGIDINQPGAVIIEKIVSDCFKNYDDEVMEFVIEQMQEFEYEINNDGFNLYSFFNLDLLEKPEFLRRSIGTEKYTCKDQQLNNYLAQLQHELQIMANGISNHSYPIATPGYNKMRWIEMKEDMETGKHFANTHLTSEENAFVETETAIKNSIIIYKKMIDYWRKKRIVL